MKRIEIQTREELLKAVSERRNFSGAVFQSLDLTEVEGRLSRRSLKDALFLGCVMSRGFKAYVESQRGLIFPRPANIPYDMYRGELYTTEELIPRRARERKGWYRKTPDGVIYQHYLKTGKMKPDCFLETLCRRLHDQAITDALDEFIEDKSVVAIMGGHAMKRTDPAYLQVVEMGYGLARQGHLVTTGGGPGAMEAAHLGAWMAGYPKKELAKAVKMLHSVPGYSPVEDWLNTAYAVRRKYPPKKYKGQFIESLGIPTWLYGHEPSTIFATRIAKYFANSVREDGLLTIATGGVIYTPGSAGTIQEIFQDTTQNHYNTLGIISPMIFFGKDYWTEQKPVIPLLKKLAGTRAYAKKIHVTDSVRDAVTLLS